MNENFEIKTWHWIPNKSFGSFKSGQTFEEVSKICKRKINKSEAEFAVQDLKLHFSEGILSRIDCFNKFFIDDSNLFELSSKELIQLLKISNAEICLDKNIVCWVCYQSLGLNIYFDELTDYRTIKKIGISLREEKNFW